MNVLFFHLVVEMETTPTKTMQRCKVRFLTFLKITVTPQPPHLPRGSDICQEPPLSSSIQAGLNTIKLVLFKYSVA